MSTESGAPLLIRRISYELGWVMLSPRVTRQTAFVLVVQAALAANKGAGVFATSRTENIAMHSSLAKLGFVAAGNPFGLIRSENQAFITRCSPVMLPNPSFHRTLRDETAPVR